MHFSNIISTAAAAVLCFTALTSASIVPRGTRISRFDSSRSYEETTVDVVSRDLHKEINDIARRVVVDSTEKRHVRDFARRGEEVEEVEARDPELPAMEVREIDAGSELGRGRFHAREFRRTEAVAEKREEEEEEVEGVAGRAHGRDFRRQAIADIIAKSVVEGRDLEDVVEEMIAKREQAQGARDYHAI